jgi:hypothetical protein
MFSFILTGGDMKTDVDGGRCFICFVWLNMIIDASVCKAGKTIIFIKFSLAHKVLAHFIHKGNFCLAL